MEENKVIIRENYINLGQLIKMLDLVSSGGETKHFLLNTPIFVNDEPENRRGRKLYKGDLITINDKEYRIC